MECIRGRFATLYRKGVELMKYIPRILVITIIFLVVFSIKAN